MRFNSDDYAELLGLYLGDGHIAAHPRTQRLRIFLDAKYSTIISETRALLERCFIDCVVGCQVAHRGTMLIPYVYSNHLDCVFPQHGPGKKHERPIILEGWQQSHVDAAPWSFIRGCIRSDGCCFVNRTDIHRPKPYEYLSYDFSNKSADIARLFIRTCDQVGVITRPNVDPSGVWHVRINRRDSVARMLENVGRKE